ncbi:MAG: tRNA (N(6)-L-threonylcarbamoyladenosine(37)-C(2))-methylthiotransferase MtaB [Deltaproteobacteria bacterium]|nr:tRNA (N(6)-L-threonylcarbamoyladenosine(37)-C(2))-methylthiotransferase MtaB [Deltaproteobacteria bacterium]
MKRFNIITLGCKVNQYESASIMEEMNRLGWKAVSKHSPVDLCIINTCTVTQKASMQSRQAMRQAIKSNPNAVIIVTGCYAQVAPEEIGAIAGVDYIIGHYKKPQIAKIADGLKHCDSPMVDVQDIKLHFPLQDMPVSHFAGRTRPFLKIQDGCNAFCSYCIVPYARGRSSSLPPETLLERIKEMSDKGYREVVLTGIHLGKYGLDLTPATDILQVLKRIESSPVNLRVRLSSIEPTEISDDLIDFIASSKKVCHHLHIPLQSGDDRILKRMNRRYSSQFYKDLIAKLNLRIPDIGIGVDVLVGFPGESDGCFANTMSLIQDLPVSYLHIFPFSRRLGTPAYDFSDQIPSKIIKQRCMALKGLDEEKRKAFYSRFMGQKVSMLVEETPDRMTGRLKGLTGNYIPVVLEGKTDRLNRLTRVRLMRLEDKKVIGSQS